MEDNFEKLIRETLSSKDKKILIKSYHKDSMWDEVNKQLHPANVLPFMKWITHIAAMVGGVIIGILLWQQYDNSITKDNSVVVNNNTLSKKEMATDSLPIKLNKDTIAQTQIAVPTKLSNAHPRHIHNTHINIVNKIKNHVQENYVSVQDPTVIVKQEHSIVSTDLIADSPKFLNNKKQVIYLSDINPTAPYQHIRKSRRILRAYQNAVTGDATNIAIIARLKKMLK